MKHFLPVVPTLALLMLMFIPAPYAAEPRTVTIDYVIGMLQAGMDQHAIVAQIADHDLTFRLASGDLDRLRAAGAGEELLRTVTRGVVVLENAPGERSAPEEAAQPPAPRQTPAGSETWSRPRRAAPGGVTVSPDTQAQGEAPPDDTGQYGQYDAGTDPYADYGDYYSYYYHPGYYDPGYYASPYYYGYYSYPYYYPSFYYSYWPYGYYGYRHYYYPGHGGGVRGVPRGIVRGRPPGTPGVPIGPAPRGGARGGAAGHPSGGGHASGGGPRGGGGHGHH